MYSIARCFFFSRPLRVSAYAKPASRAIPNITGCSIFSKRRLKGPLQRYRGGWDNFCLIAIATQRGRWIVGRGGPIGFGHRQCPFSCLEPCGLSLWGKEPLARSGCGATSAIKFALVAEPRCRKCGRSRAPLQQLVHHVR